MTRGILAIALGTFLSVFVSISPTAHAGEPIQPGAYTKAIDNPYFPIGTMRTLEYAGEERDADTGEAVATANTISVLTDARTVAGVEVLVVKDEAFAEGELMESTLDYFAQHEDGAVYYFGEDVDNYEDGVLVDHEGSWIAGEGANLPGVFMPGEPVVGVRFDQERAPGIAEDHSTVLETGLTVTVPAGTFTDCIKTEDIDPIGMATENKWYCRDVGLVMEQAEDERLELVRFTRAEPASASGEPGPASRPSVAPDAGHGSSGEGWPSSEQIGAAAGILMAMGIGASLGWGFTKGRE
jgi:hypothetical protein